MKEDSMTLINILKVNYQIFKEMNAVWWFFILVILTNIF